MNDRAIHTTNRGACVLCGAQALCRVDLRVNWFRGDDVVVKTCKPHQYAPAEELMVARERNRSEQLAREEANKSRRQAERGAR